MEGFLRLMSSTDRSEDDRRPRSFVRARGPHWAIMVAAFTVFGFSLTLRAEGSPWWGTVGLAALWLWLGCAEPLGSWRVSAPKAPRTMPIHGRVEIPVWRRTLVHLTLSWVMLSAVVAWGGRTAYSTGSAMWPWAVAALAVILIGLQVGRSLLRRPALILTPEGVRYRGPTVDAYLAWEDIKAVTGERDGKYRRKLVFAGWPASPSWQWRRRSWIPAPRHPESDPKISVGSQGPMDFRFVADVLPIARMYHRYPEARDELARGRLTPPQ